MRMFISHVNEDARIAAKLKEIIEREFLGLPKVYVSSDGETIAAGEDWLNALDLTLRETELLLVLCSPNSIRRPWINFELGAAWMLKVPIIPICHSGLMPRDLPIPLSLRQGISLSNSEHLPHLYSRIADILSCKQPSQDFDLLAKEFSEITTENIEDKEDENFIELEKNRAIGKRLDNSLNKHKFKWRSL
jgi:TIR domain